VAWAETYLRTKWHLDPSSRLAKNWGLCPFGGGSWVPIKVRPTYGTCVIFFR